MCCIFIAEMAAMAKRMKELKSLLKKSKSSPESCKKKSKTSPESEKKKHKSHSNGKSRTSPKSQNTDSLGKQHSHSKIDSDKSLKTDKQSSSDLLKGQIDKHKALLEAKGKKSKSDRHFSDIAAGSSQSSSPGSKSKEKESLKLKQNLKKETGNFLWNFLTLLNICMLLLSLKFDRYMYLLKPEVLQLVSFGFLQSNLEC
jgi:hypothetical protein